MHTHDRALVLGPGGRVGAAWTAGLARGLRDFGVDLAEADLIVGTSAGAIVAAMLATGQDLDRLVDPARRKPPAGPRSTGDAGAVFAVLGEPGLAPEEARRRVGRIALDQAGPDAEQALLAQRSALIGADAWPDRQLLITAVDAESGEPVVWDRTSGVPLVHAVAASSAFPGVEPPVTVHGRHHMDGALRAGTNADLAAGARTLVVVEPMAHRSPPEGLARQLAAVGAQTVVTIGPDPALDPAAQGWDAWVGAYRAGVRRAADVAEKLKAAWTTGA